MKFLILGGVFFMAAIWLLRLLAPPTQQKKRKFDPPEAEQVEASEAMLSCRHCGIHFPASEAVIHQADLVFCSEEHRVRHFSG